MTLQINTSTGARDLTTDEQAEARAGLAAAAAADLSAHATSTSNPHNVTKAQVGLGSVDNTSDTAKPVSTAQAAAIAAAVTAHAQAADPHPAYLTQAEAGALYSPAGAYVKPADGIPRQDLDHTIRGQLDLADAALQPGAQLTQAVVDSTTAAGAALMTGADAAAQRVALELGTAATTASTAYATAAQGTKADTAIQPGAQLTQAAVTAATAAGVALLGAASTPAQRAALGLGTAATTAATDYATAAQGAKADAALPATADAIADVLDAAATSAPADLARIQASVSKDRGFGPTIFDGIPVASGTCNYPDSMYTTVVSGSTVRRWIANRRSAGVRLAWTTTVNTGAPVIVQPLIISGSVQLDNGVTDRVRATIRGADRAYVGANGVIVSDVCPVTTKAGQGLWSFTYSAGPHQPYKGQNLSVSAWYEGNNHAVGSSGVDVTPQGGGSVVNASGGYSPIAVIGTYESAVGLPYVWCNGDSNTSGTGDLNADQSPTLASPYGKGWASRLFGPLNIPYLNTSYDGRQAGVNQAYQRQYGIGATDVINGLCINDVSSNVGNQPATSVKTRLLTLWLEQQATLNPLTHLWQITCVPNTSSTDSWATLANQTVLASEPHRLEVNNWLRDGAPMNANGTAAAIGATGVLRAGRLVSGSFVPGDAAHPIYGIIDLSPALEDPATGKWLVGKVYATDNLGIHANYSGHQAWADAAAWIVPLLQKR